MTWRPNFLKKKPLVAVIRLQGQIANASRGLDDPSMGPIIDKAFARKPVAIALQINSPGGSPVQSSLIAARIRRLADEKQIPVVAFCEDVAASGGYWLACAADEILIDPGSIVGSIGVISAGFGLQGTLDKIGAERRVHTAGRSKSFLDPFRPEKEEDVARLERWLTRLHAVFIDYVKERRGARLKDDPDLFTGEIWIGQEAVDQGLADGIGHLVPVMKDRYGTAIRFRRFGPRRSLFARFGARIVGDALGAVEDRAAFARFGL
ncbi:S49 family peptidase [Wenxinia marina]|uniref:Periplasmic serine protease (ClpP class) n=1 Tax=Wenxinia marina DSM 24838 TaxID=1123501 RepID=A0A0D0QH03_9RHOB|nr:S49 family peptidase [Wenxinia marina]KIQ70318.1 Periplasmic serine protease (ClpP class) [Wenxinia marina DSM 24838]GGL54054.1 multidrug transporter [Wenxinia marina]